MIGEALKLSKEDTHMPFVCSMHGCMYIFLSSVGWVSYYGSTSSFPLESEERATYVSWVCVGDH